MIEYIKRKIVIAGIKKLYLTQLNELLSMNNSIHKAFNERYDNINTLSRKTRRGIVNPKEFKKNLDDKETIIRKIKEYIDNKYITDNYELIIFTILNFSKYLEKAPLENDACLRIIFKELIRINKQHKKDDEILECFDKYGNIIPEKGFDLKILLKKYYDEAVIMSEYHSIIDTKYYEIANDYNKFMDIIIGLDKLKYLHNNQIFIKKTTLRKKDEEVNIVLTTPKEPLHVISEYQVKEQWQIDLEKIVDLDALTLKENVIVSSDYLDELLSQSNLTKNEKNKIIEENTKRIRQSVNEKFVKIVKLSNNTNKVNIINKYKELLISTNYKDVKLLEEINNLIITEDFEKLDEDKTNALTIIIEKKLMDNQKDPNNYTLDFLENDKYNIFFTKEFLENIENMNEEEIFFLISKLNFLVNDDKKLDIKKINAIKNGIAYRIRAKAYRIIFIREGFNLKIVSFFKRTGNKEDYDQFTRKQNLDIIDMDSDSKVKEYFKEIVNKKVRIKK